MASVGLCWPLVASGGLLNLYQVLIKFLLSSGDLWWPLVASGCLWWPLVASGGLWSFLVAVGALWWRGLWWPLVAFGHLWWHLVASGGLLSSYSVFIIRIELLLSSY